MRIHILLLLVFFVSSNLKGSVGIRSTHITTMDGLANNSIRHIHQDSKGFLWFGTLNGLSRYDGNSFVNFHPDRTKELSLADNRIRALHEDKNGFLWIETVAQIYSCYDLEKGSFVDFTGCGESNETYSRLFVASNGDMWLWHDQNGCRRIRYNNEQFSSLTFKEEKKNLPSNKVTFVSEDDQGDIWIGTSKGLAKVHQEEVSIVDSLQAFAFMLSHEGSTYFMTRPCHFFQQTASGKLRPIGKLSPLTTEKPQLTGSILFRNSWMIFTNEGVFQLDLNNFSIQKNTSLNMKGSIVFQDNLGNNWVHNKTGKAWYFDSKTSNIKEFSLMPPNKMGYIDAERYYVVHDSRGTIWISTYGNGLFAYHPETEELDHFSSNETGKGYITSDFLQYITEDRSGGIWVSSEFTGISLLEVINEGTQRIFPEKQQHTDRSNAIRMIYQLKNGDIWLGTREGGIYAYDSKLNFTEKKQSFSSNIYALIEDREGTLWIGSRGNGLRIGNDWYKNTEDPTSIASNHIFAFHEDKKGRMWIATFSGGLALAEKKNGSYQFRHFLNNSYNQKRTRVIAEDQNGMFWVGTNNGIYIFHPDSIIIDPENYIECNFQNGKLPNNEVKCLFLDRQNRMWIGTSGAGICVCEPTTDYQKELFFKNYNIKEGLSNAVVQSIIEDKTGKLWISTEYGLSRFSPQENLFENYFLSPQVLGNVYSENSVLNMDDGRILFGSNYGLVVISPNDVIDYTKNASVVFTDISINGIQTQPGEKDSPLNRELSYTNDITLKYYQNSFTIHFSTFNYTKNNTDQYSYQLVNYDKDWSSPSSLGFAAFKNIPPGDYVLKVRPTNSTGALGEETTSLKITVKPPLWQTTWAFLSYFILLSALLYIAFNIISNFNSLRNKIQIERQLTEYKLVFFTNISHEFRTPLTLIQGALEKILMLEGLPKEIRYPLKTMDKSTKRMFRLINQLLEFRKLQNNKLALSLEETDVVAFIFEIFQSFKDIAKSKKIEYTFSSSQPVLKMFIDKGYIDKVMYNLLSNAFKYTPSEKSIHVYLSVLEEKNSFQFKIIDTGVGIPKEKQGELFSRFMQSSFSGNSVGIGLHLSSELVKVHKGTLSYEENKEGGSVFTVTIPLDTSVYKERDFLISDHILAEENPANKDSETEEDIISENTRPLNKQKILIIDDDHDIREFLKQEIEKYFQVETASDGKEGLQKAQELDTDLIICDVMMPELNGFEVVKSLRENFDTSHIPIILLTALAADKNYLEGIEAGADAYITKPFSLSLLLTRIFKLIEQREVLRQKFSNEPGLTDPPLCNSSHDKEFINKLHAVLEDKLSDPSFGVDEFAILMEAGRTTFYKKMYGLIGYTPNEYIRIARMKKAAEILSSHHTLSITEVAKRVGIIDPFYFSKCFKSQFGVSPSKYKKGQDNSSE